MEIKECTKKFFEQQCFSTKFESYNDCLTGSGVAALLGLAPWESRETLKERLAGNRREFVMTWEFERGRRWKPLMYNQLKNRPIANLVNRNPVTGRRLYVCDVDNAGSGGLADGFFINRTTHKVTAGLTMRTSGLSNAALWRNHVPVDIAAQNLFYMGLCGGIQWVVAVMLFCAGEEGLENVAWELRSFQMRYDDNLYRDIREEVHRFWDKDYVPDQNRLEEIRNRVKQYAETYTGLIYHPVPQVR